MGPDMTAYGGSERRGPRMHFHRFARWWDKYTPPQRGNRIGVLLGTDEAYMRTRLCPNFIAVIGRYRGRAWPRFWLAKVEVVNA